MPVISPSAVSRVVAASTMFNVQPNAAGLPGSDEIQQLTSGLEWWALLAALIGVIVGAAAWALGAHTNNYQQTSGGRRAVLVSGAAALIIGAAPYVLSFLFTAGQAVR